MSETPRVNSAKVWSVPISKYQRNPVGAPRLAQALEKVSSRTRELSSGGRSPVVKFLAERNVVVAIEKDYSAQTSALCRGRWRQHMRETYGAPDVSGHIRHAQS